jgi:hypothetical protein
MLSTASMAWFCFHSIENDNGFLAASKQPYIHAPMSRIVSKDFELSGCNEHPTCGSTLGLVAAAATKKCLIAMNLRGMFLSCP